MKQLVLWISSFLMLHAEAPGDEGDATDNSALDAELQEIIDQDDTTTTETSDTTTTEETTETQVDDTQQTRSRENDAIRSARERAQQAERDAQQARDEAARLRAEQDRARAGPTAEQRQFEEEERQLADANVDEQTKYWIRANRQLRAANANAAAARAEVQDTKDLTAFSRLGSHPNKTVQTLYNRYAEEVEQEYNKMRAQGLQPPGRQAIMAILHQRDIINGKYQQKAKKTTAADVTQRRQQQTGARSDVQARARMSESAARRKRLEGVNI